MKKLHSIITATACVLAILLFPRASAAAEMESTEEKQTMIYYVDSRTGKDTNNGLSEQTPFRTIDRVNQIVFEPGTKVCFRSGCIFYGMLEPKGTGGKEKMIEIGRYGEGRLPVINGDGAFAAIQIKNMQYIKVSDLEVMNKAEDEEKSRCGIYVEAGGEGTSGGNYEEIHIENINVHDISSGVSRNAGGIIFDTRPALSPVTYQNVSIENCKVTNTNANGITFTSIYSKRTGIDWATEPYTPSKNIRIRNNFVANCGGDGIFQSCAIDPLIEHNTVYGTSWAGNTAYAGIWPHNSANAVMQYNEAYGQKLVGGDGQGFDVDINCDRTLVQYNYSHHNEGGFLLICTSGDQGGYNDDVTVRYNISEDDSGQIFTLSGPITNIKIYNNTVSYKEGLNTRLLGMYQWGDSGGGPDKVTIENNIFDINGNGYTQFYPDTEFVFRNNLYYGSYHYDEIEDRQKIVADPGFVGGTTIYGISNGTCFKLKESSPAVNAAKPSQFDETAQGKDKMNLGAYA